MSRRAGEPVGSAVCRLRFRQSGHVSGGWPYDAAATMSLAVGDRATVGVCDGMKVGSEDALVSELASNPPKSILVLRPGAMGDVLLTTPALRALRSAFPRARVSVLVTRSGEEILAGNPNVDEIIVLDKSSVASQTKVIPLVRRKKFDLVIDFLCNPRTALIAFLSGAPRRLGYDVRMRKIAYNLKKSRDEYSDGEKVVRYAARVNVDMLRCLGVQNATTELDFRVSETAQATMDEFLRPHVTEGRGLVGICPAGSWPAKTWEVERFAALADRISNELSHGVLILWGPGERKLAQDMSRVMKTESVLACETGIAEVGGLIRRCALFVSNDSGLKHVAVALGTPTVTIFGPTNPATWNPVDLMHRAVYADIDCLFCDKNECEEMRCMRDLDVGTVFSAVKDVLGTRSQEHGVRENRERF